MNVLLAGMDGECKDRIARCLGLAVVGFARVLERAIADAEVEPPIVENTLQGFLALLAAPIHVVLNQFHDLSERIGPLAPPQHCISTRG